MDMYNCLKKIKQMFSHNLFIAKGLIFIFALFISLAPVFAQTETTDYYWVGTSDGDWTDSNNWSTTEGGTGGDTDPAYPGAGSTVHLYGNYAVTIDTDITIKKLLIQADESFYTSDSFITTLKGSCSLTVTNNTADPAINLTRCASDAGVTGTLKIQLPVECQGTIQTHSGTTLLVDNGASLECRILEHSAFEKTPTSQLQIKGNLTVNDTLNLNANASGASQLFVDGGLVKIKNLTFGSTTYNNDGVDNAIINNGTIQITNSFTIPALSKSPYDANGTGKLLLDGTDTGAEVTFSNSYSSEITIKELQGITASKITGGGNIKIEKATFNKAVTLSGTEIEEATFKDNITLTGANTFKKFNAENLGGKTLTVNAVQTITTGGAISLSGSGTDASDRLQVEGNGSGNFNLNSVLLTGNYLSLGTGKVITDINGTAWAQNSIKAGDTNWIITTGTEHVWIGGEDTWHDSNNWLPKTLPASSDSVIINSGIPEITSPVTVDIISINGSGGIKLSSDSLTAASITMNDSAAITANSSTTLTVDSITMATGAAVTADTAAIISILSGCELEKGIKGAGTLRLIAGENYTVNPGKTIDINIENNGSLSSTGSGTISFSRSFNNRGSLSLEAAVTIGGDCDNSGTAVFDNGVRIAGNLTDTGSFTGIITFNGSNDQTFTTNSLTTYENITINKDSGSFATATGSALTAAAFKITKCSAVTIDGTGTFDSFTSAATGDINFNDATRIKSDTTLSTTGTVSFANSKNIIFDDDTDKKSFSHTAGVTRLSGNITASEFALAAVTLLGDTELTANTGDTINFNGAVNGSFNLSTVTGNSSFGSTVIGLTALNTDAITTLKNTASIDIVTLTTKTSRINCSTVKTSAGQTYNGDITLGGTSTTFTASQITFAGDIIAAGKTVIIDTPSLISTKNTDTTAVSAATITLKQNLTLSSTQVLEFSVQNILNSSDEIKKLTNSTSVKFTGPVTIAPEIINNGTITCEDKTTLENKYTGTAAVFIASASDTTFKADVDFSDTSFTHSSGKVVIDGNPDTSVTIKGNISFNDFETKRGLTFTGSNSFKNFTATGLGGKTITFQAGESQEISGIVKLSGTAAATGSRLTLQSSTEGYVWFIKCTGENNHSITFVDVKDSHNISEDTTILPSAPYNLLATKSIDQGNNSNWDFPDMEYNWEGETDTLWTDASNWSPKSIPGSGAKVIIPEGKSNYPKLIADLNLNDATGTHKGTITIEAEASFDLNDYSLTAGTITNYGLVKLTGASTALSAQTIQAKMENKAGSTVEYYGSGASPSNFAWDGSTTDGKQYANLILNQNSSGSDILQTSETLTIKQSANLSGKISVTKDLNIEENSTLSGQVSVTGSTVIAAGTGKTVSLENASNVFTGSVTIGNSDSAATINAGIVKIATAQDISIENNVYADSLSISTATGKNINLKNILTQAEQLYNGAVILSDDASLTSNTDNISFGSTINGSHTLTLKVPSTKTISVTGKVGETASPSIMIDTAASTTFNESVKINSVTDKATAGDIIFKKGGSIVSTGTTGNDNSLITSGKFITGDSFASVSPAPLLTIGSNFKHVTGISEIYGKLSAGENNITLAETSGGPITIEAANITLTGDLTSNSSLTITNSKLFKTEDGSSVTFAVSSTSSFTQNGNAESGRVMLGGSLSGKGPASFTNHVYLYGSNSASFGYTGNNITITSKNLIISRGANLTINADNISADNIVMYKGAVNANGNLRTTNDIVILGAVYNTDDNTTGIADEYAYHAARPDGWSTAAYTSYETKLPDNTTALPDGSVSNKFGASLSVAAGILFHIGKNFYANGTSLTGSAEWFIDILSNADSSICFAETYNSTITNCTVRLHNGTQADGTSNPELAQIPAENCTLTGCNNFDNTPFIITEAWTTRDNVVYAKFNRKIRNLHGELKKVVSTQKELKFYNGSDNAASYDQVHKNEAGTEQLSDTEEPEVVYFKAPFTWNTDATGRSEGHAKSTDHNGNHKAAKPYIDIPRALGNASTATQNALITDRFGKRLENYSSRTPAPQKSYGTDSGATTRTDVLDKTGPVLVQVRTGQETHETNLTNQAAYDSHNFIEFIYSETVNFGDTNNATNAAKKNTADWIPAYESGISGTENTPQNIQVSSALGYTDTSSLNFRGLKQTIASGQIHTKQRGSGSDTQDVNALYRDSTHSIKYSLAGYASNVSTDGTISGSYITWPGYIEEAATPSGSVTGAASASTKNTLVTDCATDKNGNAVYNAQIMNKPDLTVNNNTEAGTNYGPWDTQAPVFVKGHLKGNESEESYFEAIGNGNGSTLTKIEIHIADNPSGTDSFNKIWLTRFGWADTTSPATSLSPAADNLVGGSRPYAASNKTSGGLRYCTVIDQENAFKYEIGDSNSTTKSFLSIAPGAAAPFFTSSTSDRNDIPLTQDNTYINLELSDTSLQYKTTFTVSYDSSSSYITDLAGNRLKSQSLMKTIDRTSPDFKISFTPINSNKLLLIFVKGLTTQIKYNQTEIPESFETIIPYCFELGTISDSTYIFTANSAADELQIDTSTPAKILREKSNSYFTVVELSLNRKTKLEDIKTLYIRLKAAGTVGSNTYNLTSNDPLTGNTDSYVTFIQDSIGNYMQMYQAHALSDFASEIVNPLYAYNDNLDFEKENITQNLYEDDSWAVHDWNEEQKNYGTLLANKPITIISSVDEKNLTSDTSGNPEFTLKLYYSVSPTKGSQSKNFNEDIPENPLRLWMPSIPGFKDNGKFPAYSDTVNTKYGIITGSLVKAQKLSEGLAFNFDKSIAKDFKSGSQLSFLFGLCDTSGTLESICITPTLSFTAGNASYTINDKVPLFCIRLKDKSDITSLDLWSLRLKDITNQRGGVTILNNVINATKGEKSVIKIDLPSEGRLSVMVMTLDGNIVAYLNRGNTKAGEHYFTWDGKNKNGALVARGMYFVRVTGSGIDETRKIMVVKD